MQLKRKGPTAGREGKTLSTPMLVSVYAAGVVILGLCIYQAVVSPAQRWLYLALCALAAGYIAFITVMQARNKKRDAARAQTQRKKR